MSFFSFRAQAAIEKRDQARPLVAISVAFVCRAKLLPVIRRFDNEIGYESLAPLALAEGRQSNPQCVDRNQSDRPGIAKMCAHEIKLRLCDDALPNTRLP